ncbi:MAG TPA: hypothetical protein VG815_05345 [Chloroflexota bacterium]|jgi:predicted GH43/DUF377 family glycosyl hydrolase|nr:hypothetical protein [Chloroflexota bacterium]
MVGIFRRDSRNPILEPSGPWWEARGVLNPGVTVVDGKIVMIYRAVGADGISRFGRAISTEGAQFDRDAVPWAEASRTDQAARLGIEDPRITTLGSTRYVTFTKVSVSPADHPKLEWETAPFRLRSWIGTVECEANNSNGGLGAREKSGEHGGLTGVGPVLRTRNTKDLVLFPEKIGGRFQALIREWPSIQVSTSLDLKTWSMLTEVLAPVPGTWEGERLGAGPPPVRVPSGWLVLYHANEYLRFPGNRRCYRMGLAVLDAVNPNRILYRHPEPIFEPEATYEREGPVGQVVFGTGLVDAGDEYRLYYGAADGVIGVATVAKQRLYSLLPSTLRP